MSAAKRFSWLNFGLGHTYHVLCPPEGNEEVLQDQAGVTITDEAGTDITVLGLGSIARLHYLDLYTGIGAAESVIAVPGPVGEVSDFCTDGRDKEFTTMGRDIEFTMPVMESCC